MKFKRYLLKFFDSLFNLLIKFHVKQTENNLCINKILVIKLSAMGDAICMMPSIRSLRSKYPYSEIHWLTTARTNFQIFNNVIFFDGVIKLPADFFDSILFMIRNYSSFKKYDLIIDFDQYYKISEFIAIQGKYSIGFHTGKKGFKFSKAIKYDPNLNERINFMSLISETNNNSDIDYSLTELLNSYQPSPDILNILSLFNPSRNQLFIYPGSSDNAIFRRWSLDKFLSLASYFQYEMDIIFCGGPDEIALNKVIEQSEIISFNLIGKLTLLDWAYIFSRCPKAIFLGNDGGLLHLAESQNIPIVGIFGPALYKKWGSLNPLSVPIEKQLSCRPCLKGYLGLVPSKCHRGDVECMNIPVSVVLAAVNSLRRGLDKIS